MLSNITKEDFYHILKEALDKGETEPNLTVHELVEELSIKLSGIFKDH